MKRHVTSDLPASRYFQHPPTLSNSITSALTLLMLAIDTPWTMAAPTNTTLRYQVPLTFASHSGTTASAPSSSAPPSVPRSVSSSPSSCSSEEHGPPLSVLVSVPEELGKSVTAYVYTQSIFYFEKGN